MAAYNKVNGPYCTVNQHLLTKILKDDWGGFRGFVVSDWGATHATVASANAVADRYSIKSKRCSACLANRLFDDLSHFIKVNVTQHYLAETVGNTDERLVYIGISQSTGMKQAPVRRPLETFFNRIASHNPASPKQSINYPKAQKTQF